jgi:hypothetical protein
LGLISAASDTQAEQRFLETEDLVQEQDDLPEKVVGEKHKRSDARRRFATQCTASSDVSKAKISV